MEIYTVMFIVGQLFIPSINSAVPYLSKVEVSQLCPRNKFVIKYKNGTMKCNRCSRCHKGFRVKKACDMFSNTVCEPCPAGTYNDNTGNECQPCSVCSPGEFIRRHCIGKRDTKCRKCPKGYFTLSGNVTSCVPCKQCRQNENIIAKCDGVRDTECGNCYHDHFRVSSSGSCLRCSKCPYKLDLVVPECSDKLGHHNSHICWPQEITKAKPDISTTGIEEIIKVQLEGTDNGIIHENVALWLYLILSVMFVIFGVFVIYVKHEHCKKCVTEKCSKTDVITHNHDDATSYVSDQVDRDIYSLQNDDTLSVKTSDCSNTDGDNSNYYFIDQTTFDHKPELDLR
ncbi:uncharacterized protein LOC132713724 [Ruditapes philippinarum]|uniref:uncharacterized protein LOC132713724 n=1 Tax=Ruditapes philippinarum TaxID=129788 RepID=UPI00295BF8A9|nr:uncharacterized protein LOC132713724 [Ruditapes philippinarum]